MTEEIKTRLEEFLNEKLRYSIAVSFFKNSLIVYEKQGRPFNWRIKTIAGIFKIAGKPENSLMSCYNNTIYQFAFDHTCILSGNGLREYAINEIQNNSTKTIL